MGCTITGVLTRASRVSSSKPCPKLEFKGGLMPQHEREVCFINTPRTFGFMYVCKVKTAAEGFGCTEAGSAPY